MSADLELVTAEHAFQVRAALEALLDTQRVPLEPDRSCRAAGRARDAARAFWSRSRGLVLTASNLPAPPPGRTYQLWFVTAQAPVSAGLLKPDASGRVTTLLNTPTDLPQPAALAVTLEPEGGSRDFLSTLSFSSLIVRLLARVLQLCRQSPIRSVYSKSRIPFFLVAAINSLSDTNENGAAD